MDGPARLAKYLEVSGISQNEFGRLCEVSEGIVCRWVNGTRRPGADYIFVIERASKGQVPASSWERARRKPHPPRVA